MGLSCLLLARLGKMYSCMDPWRYQRNLRILHSRSVLVLRRRSGNRHSVRMPYGQQQQQQQQQENKK